MKCFAVVVVVFTQFIQIEKGMKTIRMKFRVAPSIVERVSVCVFAHKNKARSV